MVDEAENTAEESETVAEEKPSNIGKIEWLGSRAFRRRSNFKLLELTRRGWRRRYRAQASCSTTPTCSSRCPAASADERMPRRSTTTRRQQVRARVVRARATARAGGGGRCCR